jgi:hypothetical protein
MASALREVDPTVFEREPALLLKGDSNLVAREPPDEAPLERSVTGFGRRHPPLTRTRQAASPSH